MFWVVDVGWLGVDSALRMRDCLVGTRRKLGQSNHCLRRKRIVSSSNRTVTCVICDVVHILNVLRANRWNGLPVPNRLLLRRIVVVSLGNRRDVNLAGTAFFSAHHNHRVQLIGVVDHLCWVLVVVALVVVRRDRRGVRLMELWPTVVAQEAAAAPGWHDI